MTVSAFRNNPSNVRCVISKVCVSPCLPQFFVQILPTSLSFSFFSLTIFPARHLEWLLCVASGAPVFPSLAGVNPLTCNKEQRRRQPSYSHASLSPDFRGARLPTKEQTNKKYESFGGMCANEAINRRINSFLTTAKDIKKENRALHE